MLLSSTNRIPLGDPTLDDPAPSSNSALLIDAAPGCLELILRHHPTIGRATDPRIVLTLVEKAAMVILQAEDSTPGLLPALLARTTDEAAPVQLSLYTAILLASISASRPLPASSLNRLLVLYPIIGRALHLCLRAVSDALLLDNDRGEGAEMLQRIFALFRLVLVRPASASAEDKQHSEVTTRDDAVHSLWSRVWPEWERQIETSVGPTCRSDVRTSFTSCIAES